jgi:hypothetical protein
MAADTGSEMEMDTGVIQKKEGQIFQGLRRITGTINGYKNFFFHGWVSVKEGFRNSAWVILAEHRMLKD